MLGAEAAAPPGPPDYSGKARRAVMPIARARSDWVIAKRGAAWPPNLPPAVREKPRADIEKALAEPTVLEKFTAFGYVPFPAPREGFPRYIQDESAAMAEVIKATRSLLD